MRNYSDPTANAAIGSVEREFKAKQKLAKTLRLLRLEGKIGEKDLAKARRQFTGIFAHLFDEVLRDADETQNE